MVHTNTHISTAIKRVLAGVLTFALWMNNAGQAFAITYDSTTSTYFDSIDDYGLAGGSTSIGLQFGGTLGEFLRFDQSIGRFVFSDDLDVQGTLSGSALTVMAGTSYFLGNVGIGTAATPEARLEVAGTISGSRLKITGTAAISGALMLESGNTLSGSILQGFGLSDCDNATTSKLLWDATTGRFSCGTDQTGGSSGGLSLTDADARYVRKSGSTMTGQLVLESTSLNVQGSGAFVGHDPNDVVLLVKGTGSQAGNLQNWVDATNTMLVNISYNGSFWTDQNVSANWLQTRGVTSCSGVLQTDLSGFVTCGSESDPVYYSNPNSYVNSSTETDPVYYSNPYSYVNSSTETDPHYYSNPNGYTNNSYAIDLNQYLNTSSEAQFFNVSASHTMNMQYLNVSNDSTFGDNIADSMYFYAGNWGFANETTLTMNGGPLRVRGILSGVTLYATRSFSGAGLSDCDNATTSKLLWDATTGRFSCGTDQSGGSSGGLSLTDADARYVRKAGGTMTGKLTLSNTMLDVTGSGWFVNIDGNDVVLTVRGNTSQSVNLQDWRDGSNVGVANVTANGSFNAANANVSGFFGVGGNTTLGTSTSNTITLNGAINSNVTANANNAYGIGNSTNRFATAWLTGANIGGSLNVSGSSSIDGTLTTGNIGANGHVYPSLNDTYAMGNSSNRWSGGWFVNANLSSNLNVLGTSDLTGNVAIGGATTTKTKLAVNGIMSGVTLYATKSFSGAGLSDCDNATTSKLLWDATTGRFSCGTDQSGGTGGGLDYATASGIFLKRSGGTMTGVLRLYNPNSGSPEEMLIAESASSEASMVFMNTTTGNNKDTDGLYIGNYHGPAFVVNREADGLNFGTSNFAAININSAGLVGIGTDTNTQANATIDAKLEVVGTVSGATINTNSFFQGSGLSDCDNATTSKLLWDATTGRFSCGTDQSGGSSGGGMSYATASGIFLKRSGGTMTGTLRIDTGTLGQRDSGTGLVVFERATFLSGATLSGQLLIRSNGDPGTAPEGHLYLYAKQIADRNLVKIKGSSGVDYALQPSLFQNNVAMWFPATGTTAGHIFGWTFTSAGTVSHPTIASTNMLTQMRRTRWASTTTANGVGGIFSAQTLTWRGNAAGLGGFFFFARFGQAVNTNGARSFVGLAAASSHVVAAEPSAAVNMVGMGYDSTDSSGGNYQLMHNDGSGTATKIDLGSGAPRGTSNVYDFFIFAPPNGSTISVRVNNVGTGLNVYEGTLSSDLPTSTTFLRAHAGNGPAATATQQQFELNRLYLESDT